jgi:hypothetical protein
MYTRSFVPKSRAGKLVVGVAACLAFAFASGLALAGGSGVYIPELGVTVPEEKVAAIQHSLPRQGAESTEQAPAPTGSPDRIPAKLLGPEVPVPISPSILRTTNGWLVSDGATLVAVYAGAAGDDPSRGRFVIVRQNLVRGVQTQDVVDAGSTGALEIVGAPLGAAVETSAQRGNIGFRGARGARGVLHLAADTVEVH